MGRLWEVSYPFSGRGIEFEQAEVISEKGRGRVGYAPLASDRAP